MSDSVLSQDELDALLQGSSLENNSSEALNNVEEHTLNKLFNTIATARVAVLSQLTNSEITVEQVSFLSGSNSKITEDLTSEILGNSSSIAGDITGDWIVLAPEATALQITNKMLSEEAEDTTEDSLIAFGEALSNMVASDAKVLSEQLKMTLSPSLAETHEFVNGGALITSTDTLFRIGINIMIDGASFPLYIVSSMKFVKNISKILNPPVQNENPQINNDASSNGAVNMVPAQFQQFTTPNNVESLDNLALLLDVPMRVTVELGRTRMTIKDILNLGEGSIVELEKLAGEPVDVLVNDKLIALGEVVVIDENFSVRVTKVVTPMERIFDRENLHGKGGV